jgi:hypothetical protein
MKEENDGVFFFPSREKKKKKHREKKCKEGWGLILPLSLLHLG